MNLEISNRAFEFIKNLDAKQFKQIMLKILSLLKDPDLSDLCKLKGFNDYYRVSVGEFRIIYRTDDNNLFIDLIGKRNDDEIYKILNKIT